MRDKLLKKKVERVPKRVEEQRFEETIIHNKNVSHCDVKTNAENNAEINDAEINAKINRGNNVKNNLYRRDGKFDNFKFRNFKFNNFNSNVKSERFTKPKFEEVDMMSVVGGNHKNENLRSDDRVFEGRKRKYIDWNPYLGCKFLNPNCSSEQRYGLVRMDSGAYQSMIHESQLPFCKVLKTDKYDGDAFGAGGESIPLANFTVDIAMEIEDLGVFILRKVLVSKTQINPFRPNSLRKQYFLLGLSDMNRLKV